jgi:predicted PurR-regulated permease PerM
MFQKIEISHRTIIFTVLFLIFLWLLYYIRDIILEFFVALLIMTILNPLVTRLSRLKIPRGFSVLVVYLLAIGMVVGVIGSIVPAMVEQTAAFAQGLPKYFASLGAWTFGEQVLRELISILSGLPSQIVKISLSFFSNLLSVLTVLILAFYLLLVRNKLDEQLAAVFGEDKIRDVGRILDLLEKKLGGWARGQITLMVLVGAGVYVGLTLLGIPFALPLAILAGLLEIVPYLGPILSGIPAVIIGLGISPLMGVAALALYFLVQQVENYVIVPKVMEKSVGVSPIITLLALAIGARLVGVVGIIISVPVVIMVQVLSREFIFKKTD